MSTVNTFLAYMNNFDHINDKVEVLFSKSGRIFLATSMRAIRSIDDDWF